jgi:hypothetical protein
MGKKSKLNFSARDDNQIEPNHAGSCLLANGILTRKVKRNNNLSRKRMRRNNAIQRRPEG